MAGGGKGAVPQSPPDQGFPSYSTALRWEFGASQTCPRAGQLQAVAISPALVKTACEDLRLGCPHAVPVSAYAWPHITLPRKQLQNWDSEGRAKSRIWEWGRDGGRGTLGRGASSPTARGWETQSSPLLPDLPGEDPAFSPDQPLLPSCEEI